MNQTYKLFIPSAQKLMGISLLFLITFSAVIFGVNKIYDESGSGIINENYLSNDDKHFVVSDLIVDNNQNTHWLEHFQNYPEFMKDNSILHNELRVKSLTTQNRINEKVLLFNSILYNLSSVNNKFTFGYKYHKMVYANDILYIATSLIYFSNIVVLFRIFDENVEMTLIIGHKNYEITDFAISKDEIAISYTNKILMFLIQHNYFQNSAIEDFDKVLNFGLNDYSAKLSIFSLDKLVWKEFDQPINLAKLILSIDNQHNFLSEIESNQKDELLNKYNISSYYNTLNYFGNDLNIYPLLKSFDVPDDIIISELMTLFDVYYKNDHYINLPHILFLNQIVLADTDFYGNVASYRVINEMVKSGNFDFIYLKNRNKTFLWNLEDQLGIDVLSSKIKFMKIGSLIYYVKFGGLSLKLRNNSFFSSIYRDSTALREFYMNNTLFDKIPDLRLGDIEYSLFNPESINSSDINNNDIIIGEPSAYNTIKKTNYMRSQEYGKALTSAYDDKENISNPLFYIPSTKIVLTEKNNKSFLEFTYSDFSFYIKDQASFDKITDGREFAGIIFSYSSSHYKIKIDISSNSYDFQNIWGYGNLTVTDENINNYKRSTIAGFNIRYINGKEEFLYFNYFNSRGNYHFKSSSILVKDSNNEVIYA